MRILLFLLFISCTIDEQEEECQVNKQGLKECNLIYECYYY
jgi:hypothetical protein